MFKLRQQHTISELDEQSLSLISGGKGESTTVEVSQEEAETDTTESILGGTKLPPP